MPDTPQHTLSLPLSRLPDALRIPTLSPGHRFDLSLRTPGSKSETNRAIVLAALARGTSTLNNALTQADDAQRALEAICTLGAQASTEGSTITITGVDGRWPIPEAGVTIDLNNAGTATRFLAAAAMLAPAPVTITGNERMRQRPIGQLAVALHDLGAQIHHHEAHGCPPLTITPPAGGPAHAPTITIDTPDSSQFVSALLMLGPWLPGGMTVKITGEVTSAPYLSMTLDLLDRVGATVHASEDMRTLRCAPPTSSTGLDAFTLDIEPDASGATYFWTAAALTPGSTATIPGLSERSIQGDARYVTLLERMGCQITRTESSIGVTGPVTLGPILADLSYMPDTAMSLAVACCFATGTSVLRGLRTLRVKETDRIAAMHTELSKLGVGIAVQGDDAITITPPSFQDKPRGIAGDDTPIAFDTYDDHRMAMSLALVGLRRQNTAINDPACVAKTYPTFFHDLARLY